MSDHRPLAPGSKDWCDVIQAMIDSAIARFNTRRQFGWRLAFGIWGFLALAISKATTLPSDIERPWVVVPFGAIVILGHGFWEWTIYTRGKEDRAEGVELDKLLRHYLGPEVPGVRSKSGDYPFWRVSVPPVAVTALLIMLFAIAI